VKKTSEHRVKGLNLSIRLVDYCGSAFELLGSKSAAKKALSGGRVRLNGQRAYASDFIENGDKLTLIGDGMSKAKAYDMGMPIVFEDEHLIIVNKPAGIAVNGNRYKTVENALVGVAKKSNLRDALHRPVASHRLDVPTKGLVLLAKNKSSLIKIGRQFQEGQIHKEYHAIVHGKVDEKGRIEMPIGGKSSTTVYERVEVVPSRVYKNLSLVKLMPITGRTHQLRIHMQAQNHLLLGDKEYAGAQKTILGKGLFLCSTQLIFNHPDTFKRTKIEIDIPSKFLKLLERERSRY